LLGNRIVDEYLDVSKTYLNKITPDELKRHFESAQFKVLIYSPADECHNILGRDAEFKFEGESFLELDSEDSFPKADRDLLLSKCPREVLLSRAYQYVCQK